MMNKIVIASIFLLFCICLVECEEERKCLICLKHKKVGKAVKVSSIKAEKAFPLKDGEGAIREEKETDEEGLYDTYTVYGDKRVYLYIHGKDGDIEMIYYLTASVEVEKTDTYSYYKIEDVEPDGSSYVWFNDKAALGGKCDLKPGKYSINDYNSKCESIAISLDLDSYVFKTTEDGKEAYTAYSKSNVGYIDEYRKHEVKSFAELNSIMSSYPQSSSVIIPSILMVLALLFLLM